VRPGNLHKTLAGIETSWKRVMPLYPFDYHFIDQEIEKTYRVE